MDFLLGMVSAFGGFATQIVLIQPFTPAPLPASGSYRLLLFKSSGSGAGIGADCETRTHLNGLEGRARP